jgi:hypothetical protein
MDSKQIRLDLIQWLSTMKDVKILHQIAQLKATVTENQVNYATPGQPMTRDEFSYLIESSRKRVDNGQFTSMEDFEKEIEQW